MKFKYKIVLMCLSLYTVALLSINFLISKNTYDKMLTTEITRNLNIEETIYLNLAFNLKYTSSIDNSSSSFQEFSDNFVNTFGNSTLLLSIVTSSGSNIASNYSSNIPLDKNELNDIKKLERSYILKHIDKTYYMIVYHKFSFSNKAYYFKTIRDISVVDTVSKENSRLILNISLVVSIIFIILTLILTSFLMKPITKLTGIVKYISSGNYSKRIDLKNNKNDEIGQLSNYFNIMADVIEDKISTLEDENQRKQSFIDNLSHEIRTPLTSIIGFSDLLKNMDYNKESFDKGLNFINSEGKRLLNISKILLNIARLKEEEMEFETIDASIVLNEIYTTMKIKYKDSNTSLKLQLSSEKYLFNVNKDMITLTIFNLIDNAFNASRESGSILFGTTDYNNKPCIFVQDNGIGMSEDDISKIFDPFYRIDKTRSRETGGAGLGLSICTEIMNLHNGKIVVESMLDKGTTFYVLF